MPGFQGKIGLCWVFAGAQCVHSFLLSTYGINLDLAELEHVGQGQSNAATGNKFPTFLKNLKGHQFASCDWNAVYELDLVADDITTIVTSGKYNTWNSINPYVSFTLPPTCEIQGQHAVAGLRYSNGSPPNHVVSKNWWGTVSMGQVYDVPINDIIQVMIPDVRSVLKFCRDEGQSVAQPVPPLQRMSKDVANRIFANAQREIDRKFDAIPVAPTHGSTTVQAADSDLEPDIDDVLLEIRNAYKSTLVISRVGVPMPRSNQNEGRRPSSSSW